MPSLPLTGIRVVDLSQLLPGPFCTWLMAEFGADVLRIEAPAGDFGHRIPPLSDGTSLFYLSLNRGKRSLGLDLKQDSARGVFRKLISEADVLLEGFRPGVMSRLGFAYDQLRAINPKLIYCAITGFGYDGPYSNRVGHDLNYLALSGILGIQAEVATPSVFPVQIADIGAGALPAFAGILLALAMREKTMMGSFVDVSMLDGLVSWLAPYAGHAHAPWTRNAMLRGELACYNVYRTADDRYLSVGCVEPKFWSTFCRAIGHEEWVALQADGTAQRRIRRELQAIFANQSADYWRQFFSEYEVCVAPIITPEEMEQDPQIQQRGSVYSDEVPNHGELRVIRPPIRISDCETRTAPPPAAGENSVTVLRELGYSTEEIQELFRAGAVFGPAETPGRGESHNSETLP